MLPMSHYHRSILHLGVWSHLNWPSRCLDGSPRAVCSCRTFHSLPPPSMPCHAMPYQHPCPCPSASFLLRRDWTATWIGKVLFLPPLQVDRSRIRFHACGTWAECCLCSALSVCLSVSTRLQIPVNGMGISLVFLRPTLEKGTCLAIDLLRT